MSSTKRSSRLPRFRRLLLVGASFGILGVAVVAWAGSAMWTLTRLDASLADECSRVEAASRARTVLVRNLIESCRSFGGPDAVHVNALEAALDDVDPTRVSAGAARLGEPFAQHRDAELELSSALEEFWAAARRSSDERSARLVADLESRIEHATLGLVTAMTGLSDSVDEYRRASDGFPGSVLGVIFGSATEAAPTWDPQASGEAAGSGRPSG